MIGHWQETGTWLDNNNIRSQEKVCFQCHDTDKTTFSPKLATIVYNADVHNYNYGTGGLTISVQKTKSMAFKGRDPIRSKIVIYNKIIEQQISLTI
jgi:hypothetical protein